jgi:ribonuclease D
VTAMQEIGWIDNDAALARLVAVLGETSIAAIDTEFVREKTYYPQLCLIQVAAGEQVACIDCLASVDLDPLYARLFDASFTWVVHSARQDLEVIFQRTGRMPPRLVDTQVAAAFTGYPPQVGLEGLLQRSLGVELGESFARTDWSRRPLPEPALKYAFDDVRYMLAAWDKLDAELQRLGRSRGTDERPAAPVAARRRSADRHCGGVAERRDRTRRARAVEVHGALRAGFARGARIACRPRAASRGARQRGTGPTRQDDRQSPAGARAPARRRARHRARNPRDPPRPRRRRPRLSSSPPPHRLARTRAREHLGAQRSAR